MHPLGSLSFLRHHGKLRPEMPVTTDSGFPWKSPTTEFTNPTGEHPLATARRIGNRQVFLAGWRPHEQLPQALNAADALVLPSVAEAFGLVLVEAMACGLPVIACRTHGPAALVADGKTGWLIPPTTRTRSSTPSSRPLTAGRNAGCAADALRETVADTAGR